MPPPSSEQPPPPGSEAAAAPPGDALFAAERAGPLLVEGDLVAVAAIEAAMKHPRKLGWGARLALGWIILVVGAAILAPILPIGDPNKTVKLDPPCPTSVRFGIKQENCYITALGPFSEEGTARGYLLGGDGNSRSMLARLVYGGRASLEIAVGAVLLGLLIGGSLGLIAGYFGGRIDTVLAGTFNVLLSIPAIVLALSLVAFLTPKSDANSGAASGLPVEVILIISIGVVSIPLLGRITRASALTWSQREFVLAARAQGAKNRRIMIREVLPNVLPAMFSIALLGIAVAIVAEAGLSILGVGVRPPTPSWGNMIAYDRGYLNTGAPHTVFEPAIMIFLTVLSLNYLGDVVRARFDVRESAI